MCLAKSFTVLHDPLKAVVNLKMSEMHFSTKIKNKGFSTAVSTTQLNYACTA